MVPQTTAAVVLLALLASACVSTVSADPSVCGGFVRPFADLNKALNAAGDNVVRDYASVQVELVRSPSGSVVDRAECMPNGYYVLPVYDDGSYLVRVDAPAGWAFSETSVAVSVAGGECKRASDGQSDVNFELVGFSLSGTVASADKSCTAAPGLSVALSRAGDATGTALATTTSDASGSFVFPALLPGSYDVRASHASWTLSKAATTGRVAWGAAVTAEPLQVSGYAIEGSVASNGEPVADVQFFLYATSAGAAASPTPACAKTLTMRSPQRNNVRPVCAATSGADGRFAFTNIPCGSYVAVPYYKTGATQYDLKPAEALVDLTAGHGVAIATPFAVVGFSVSGRVVGPDATTGMSAVEVLVDGEKRAVTGSDGGYSIQHFAAGTYSLSARKAGVTFRKIDGVRVAPSTGTLPDVPATGFDICGSVLVQSRGTSGVIAATRRLTITSDDGFASTVTADAQGKYCATLAPGRYDVMPVVSSDERAAGLAFAPAKASVTVDAAPVKVSAFRQALFSIAGRVRCIDGDAACTTGLHVTLTSPRTGSAAPTMTVARDGTWRFADVTPDSYTVRIDAPTLCWDRDAIPTTVVDVDIVDVVFIQTGFMLSCKMSHAARVAITHKASGEVSGFALKRGDNSMCVAATGEYTVKPEGCFDFEHSEYAFRTSSAEPLIMNAVNWHLPGTIRAPADTSLRVDDLRIDVQVGSDTESSASLTPQRVDTADGVIFKFVVHAKIGATMRATPRILASADADARALRFSPASVGVIPSEAAELSRLAHESGACPGTMTPIYAKPGVYLRGTVSPGIADVTITVTDSATGDVLATTTTAADGSYQAGPVVADQQVEVSASRDGYHFVRKDDTGFQAVELGSIRIHVKSDAGEAVSGVLLALSSADHRATQTSDDTGAVVFANLWPGDYYLRPVLKEFTFTPASLAISVGDADNLVRDVAATRVAFSVHGRVLRLNGQGEAGVTIEAVAEAAREEAVTEADGSYRVRGLVPGTPYAVLVVADDTLERAVPAQRAVTLTAGADASNVDFTVFRADPDIFHVTGRVAFATDRALIPDPEAAFLANTTITLQQIRRDGAVNVASVVLSSVNWFEFTGLRTGARYRLSADSSLPDGPAATLHRVSSSPVDVQNDGRVHAVPVSVRAVDAAAVADAETERPLYEFGIVALIVAAVYFRNDLQAHAKVLRDGKPVASTTSGFEVSEHHGRRRRASSRRS